MRRLEALLEQTARSDAELQRKILEKGDLQLLDLACGACHEANTLARVFGSSEREAGHNRKMQFFGLDVRAREIAEAATRFTGDLHSEYSFINGDATK